MTPLILSLLYGGAAASLGVWALVRQDVRLQDFRSGRETAAEGGAASGRRTIYAFVVGAVCLTVSAAPAASRVRTLLLLPPCALIFDYAWRSGQKRRKAGAMRSEWPLLLEGMAVAAESGLDLPGAFLSAVRRASGCLRHELDKASLRVAGGMQLSRALEQLSNDGVPGADRLRTLLLQAEVLGTPVAEVLQALALEARTVERQQVEARFNSLPLKLSVVTVIFLLPPVLIVSIAPHVLVFLNSRW